MFLEGRRGVGGWVGGRLSGWMFSSCAPCSAFVLGVNIGVSNFCDSTSPVGICIPWTVPKLLYSFHPDPTTACQHIQLHRRRGNESMFRRGLGGTRDVSTDYCFDGYDSTFLDQHTPFI